MSHDFDFDGAGNGPTLKVGEEKEIGHGLKKKLVKEGEGSDTPEVGDEVRVHYTGRLVDGTTFYSSRDIGIPFDFTVGEDALINGLNSSILTMKNGEVASFTIPPHYGFGSTQIEHVLAPIPPHSTLCYEVELLSLVKVKKPCDMNTEERIEAAGKKKGEGNDLFNAGQYARASKRYEKARKFLEYNTDFGEEEKKSAKALKVVCNLKDAECKLKLKEYKEAEELCTQVLELDSSNAKAHFIRAQAYIRFAEVDFEKALEIDPNNMEVKLEYKTLKEKVKDLLPSQLVSSLATTLQSDLQHQLLDSLKPKLEESLYSRLLPSLRNTLASQLAPLQKSPPPTPSPIPSADNQVRHKNSEESKEISLMLNLSGFSLRLFSCMILFIAFVHGKANDVKSDLTLQTTVLLMAFLVHTWCVFSFDGLWSTSSATETLLGRCWGMLALNGCISIGASVLISVYAGKVCRTLYILAFCGEWVACMSAFVARRRLMPR